MADYIVAEDTSDASNNTPPPEVWPPTEPSPPGMLASSVSSNCSNTTHNISPDVPASSILDRLRGYQDYQPDSSPTQHNYIFAQSKFNATDCAPSVSDSIVRIVTNPQEFGLRQDSLSLICIRRRLHSLVDGSTNICITGNLSILLSVKDIPPMSIMVAASGKASLDDCCTKQGYLPLTLPDPGQNYYPPPGSPCIQQCIHIVDTDWI
jgi:hypothetical protein